MSDQEFVARLGQVLGRAGVDLASLEALKTALTHTSYAYEASHSTAHNERLEFIGDAVLGLCIAEALYRADSEAGPGIMTRIRARLVSRTELAAVAQEWGLGEALRLGRSEELGGGRARESNLSRALEAVIGAVYLNAGVEPARLAIHAMLGHRLEQAVSNGTGADPKSRLQELTQAWGQSPAYRTVGRSGPDHMPCWSAAVSVGDISAQGDGPTLRQAEKEAAQRLLLVLQWHGRGPAGSVQLHGHRQKKCIPGEIQDAT